MVNKKKKLTVPPELPQAKIKARASADKAIKNVGGGDRIRYETTH